MYAQGARSGRFLRCRGAVPRGCALGILAALIIVAVLGIYVMVHQDAIFARHFRGHLDSLVEAMELPAQDAARVQATLHRLPDALEEGDIDRSQFNQAVDELFDSPAMRAALIRVMDVRYYQPSTLSDEEKEQAQRKLNQFAHGLAEGKIPPEQDEKLRKRFLHEPDDPASGARPSLSEQELRDTLEFVDESVAGLDLSDEPLDVVAELHHAVSRALAGVGVGEMPQPRHPQPQPAPQPEPDQPQPPAEQPGDDAVDEQHDDVDPPPDDHEADAADTDPPETPTEPGS